MNLAALLDRTAPTALDDCPFPLHLLGAFRRKSITFCTGATDETTVVYWFQSRSFTIDLRLPDGAATPVAERQGWVGDTVWDDRSRQLSWKVRTSYQPRNQWPEPAELRFIGNSVLEFAPSGAYVEDWRQLSSTGPLLGLRLVEMRDDTSGEIVPMEGGLVLAGAHAAYAQSRLPSVEAALRGTEDLQRAFASGIVSEAEIESYEVSVSIGADATTHSTRPDRIGQPIASGDFAMDADGSIVLSRELDGTPWHLRFTIDHYSPEFAFGVQTPCDAAASAWMLREAGHLFRHV